MKRRTSGFTMIELVVVILIGSILVGVAISTFQSAQSALATRSARTMYATLHQRARARAVELGQTVLFIVNSAGDSAYMISNGQTTDQTNFRRELNIDLRSSPDSFLICMTPRGYADYECPILSSVSASSTAIKLEFWLNADSSSVTILPMGQLVGM